MSYDYFCGLCGDGTTDENSVRAVEDDPGSAFHFECADKIAEAVARGRQARGRCVERSGQKIALEQLDLEPVLARIQRMEAVWKLWISDAEKGSITPGTFNTMKHLMGIEG